MRRGSCGGIGPGVGGFIKPPPTPLPHINIPVSRARLHSVDLNGSVTNDRFGTQRERSPSFAGTMPHSPSHLGGRDKSPNPTAQDLHDCSMCLLAYIQSLNTVCGTACRLSQCLSQVASDTSTEGFKVNSQWPNIVKESADVWEGIARAVGIASSNAKTQMISVLQDVQIRPNDYPEHIRRQEIAKVVHSMLQMFLNLHCQFSLAVLEKFSGVLHNLKDDGLIVNSGLLTNLGPMDNGQHTSPSPPMNSQNIQIPMFFPPKTSNVQSGHSNIMNLPHLTQTLGGQQQQQLLMQQQNQQILQQRLSLQQHILHLAQQQQKSSSNERHLKEESFYGASHPSSTSGSPWSGNPGSPISASNSSPNVNTSQARHTSLSPGLLSTVGMPGAFNEWNNDATIRRWSMGGPSDGWIEKMNCLTPFNMFANRRWSVPEATEDPHTVAFPSSQPMYGLHSNSQSRECIQRLAKSASPRPNQPPTQTEPRSPSHSRSATPEHVHRAASVYSDEFQSIVDLLSLPLLSEETKCGPLECTDGSKLKKDSPSRPAAFQQQIPDSVNEESIGQDRPMSIAWTERRPSQEQFSKASDEGKSLISTPLWPPTETVPGVTLTECSGGEENPIIQGWNDRNDTECSGNFSRDSPNRASWPVASLNRYSTNGTWDLPEEMIGNGCDTSGSEGGWPPSVTPTFRRHSTDAPYLLPQGQTLLGSKTRSFENLTKCENGGGKNSSLDSNIQNLLYMGSLLPNVSASSSDSQYSLFTQTN